MVFFHKQKSITSDLLSLTPPLTQGCGVGVGGVACFQLESESGVGFQELLESESVF